MDYPATYKYTKEHEWIELNGKEGKAVNLVSNSTFGSFQLYLEFMLAKGSNSGVYLHGLYEIQVFDSYGFNGPLTPGDCGGIYEQDGGGGSAPLRNACKPPGEWQSLRIWFQAAADGKRPRVLRVLLNDTLVQENVELPGPTVSHMKIAEGPRGPIMQQGQLFRFGRSIVVRHGSCFGLTAAWLRKLTPTYLSRNQKPSFFEHGRPNFVRRFWQYQMAWTRPIFLPGMLDRNRICVAHP